MSDVKSVVRALPKLEVLEKVLERNAAGLMSSGLWADEVQELRIAIHLLKSIEFTPVKKHEKGVHCRGCEKDLAAPSDGAVMALPLCWRCMAMQNLVSWAQNNPEAISLLSLRFKGHHYGCVTEGSMDEPVMTVVLHDGGRVVTTALRYQGPVPKAYREILKDNCVIYPGNPEGLPLGVTLP